MSGEPEVWAVYATGLSLEGPKKRLIDAIDRLLLEYQFVTTKKTSRQTSKQILARQEMLRHGHEEFG